MLETDVFYSFIRERFDVFKSQNGTTLNQAWESYRLHCEETGLPLKLTMVMFREELKSYFDEFHERAEFDGAQARNVYEGFKLSKEGKI